MLNDDNEIDTKIIDNGIESTIDNNNYNTIIERGSFLECIIRCTGLWIYEDGIGITLSVISIKK